MSGRDHRGVSSSWTRPQRTTGGERPHRMDKLVAAAYVVIPRGKPHIDPASNGGRLAGPVADRDTSDYQQNAENSQSPPSTGDCVHGKKHGRHNQRGPEVFEREEQEKCG